MTLYSETVAARQQEMQNDPTIKKKNWLATMLFCAFMGPLGIHRFYTGYPVIGVLQLLTLGGCGLWMLIDYIMILLNKFNDGDGNSLDDYNSSIATIFFVLTFVGTIIALMFPSK